MVYPRPESNFLYYVSRCRLEISLECLRADYHHQLLLIHDSSMGQELSPGTAIAADGGHFHPSLDVPCPARTPRCPWGGWGGGGV